MKNKYIFLSLAVVAGLFCFMIFGGRLLGRGGEPQIPDSNPGQADDLVSGPALSDNPVSGPALSDDRPDDSRDGDGGEKSDILENESSNSENRSEAEASDDLNPDKNSSKKNGKDDSGKKETGGKSDKDKDKVGNSAVRYTVSTKSIDTTTLAYQKDLRKLAYTVLESFVISQDASGCNAGFTLPECDENTHVGVKLQLFRKTATGDETLFRYISDEGWLSAGGKSASGKQSIGIQTVYDLENCKAVLEIKAFDLTSGTIQVYDANWNEGGAFTLLCMESKQ